MQQKILIHACCAPCSAFVIDELIRRNFQVTVFFYNPNIYPEQEYNLRKEELKKYCNKLKISYIDQDNHEHDLWLQNIKGLEQEPERGKRCAVCFKLRLTKTAEFAKQNNFPIFATTLTISPHKDSDLISSIGRELAEQNNLEFLAEDWKKNNGYAKSCEISKEQNFYRQTYCGCEFSIRK
jgi:predicted adenine nucleotide alpha hydrolase (AANH) superfamily ATPase